MTYKLLRDMRIVECAAFIAAPLAALTLGQLGAEVFRVDPIGGSIDYRRQPQVQGGRSIYWTSLNKGKKSVAVDTRSPEGRELVAALATIPGPATAVFLTNLGGRGLDPAALHARRADLIACRIEGNPDGSSAVDYTVNCATGLPMMTGQGGAPVNHVLPAWDIACALQASTAILAAARSGEGADLRIALSDVAFSTLAHLGFLTEAELLEVDRPPSGNDIYGAFGRDFVTRDGQRIMIAAISARQWRSLVRACKLEEVLAGIEAGTGLHFADEGDRYAGRDMIAAIVRHWCAARPLDEIAALFDADGVAWGRYQTLRQALSSDPRLGSENPVFELLMTSGIGRHLSAGSTVRLGGAPREATLPAPELGADTDQVLAETLGLSAGQIGDLHDRGIVSGPEG